MGFKVTYRDMGHIVRRFVRGVGESRAEGAGNLGRTESDFATLLGRRGRIGKDGAKDGRKM